MMCDFCKRDVRWTGLDEEGRDTSVCARHLGKLKEDIRRVEEHQITVLPDYYLNDGLIPEVF